MPDSRENRARARTGRAGAATPTRTATVAPGHDRREDGLRRLSTLTVTVALASAAATGVVAAAAHHASTQPARSTTGATTGGGDAVGDTAGGGLQAPAGAPGPGGGLAPDGVSSGS